MFEVYVQHQGFDGSRGRRFVGALAVATTLVAAAGAWAWTVDKLDLSRVAPPSFDHLRVEMPLSLPEPVRLDPPPSPKPPSTATAPASAPATGKVPRDPGDAPDSSPRDDTVDPNDALTDRTGGPHGDPLADIGGGGPPCPGCPAIVGPGRRSPIATPGPRPQTRSPVGHRVPKALFDPDPDPEKLARTRTGQTTRRGGTNRTAFCIDPHGRVTDIRTVKPFPGDPGIDRVVRETVARWRFRPMQVDGRGRRTCTEATFRIRFTD